MYCDQDVMNCIATGQPVVICVLLVVKARSIRISVRTRYHTSTWYRTIPPMQEQKYTADDRVHRSRDYFLFLVNLGLLPAGQVLVPGTVHGT